jgi:hypothetical protein
MLEKQSSNNNAGPSGGGGDNGTSGHHHHHHYPHADGAFDAATLQVEIRATPVDPSGRGGGGGNGGTSPSSSSSAAAVSSSLLSSAVMGLGLGVGPVDLERDQLFVSLLGVKKLVLDAESEQSFQAQAELRVGPGGPFEVSRVVAVKKSTRSAVVRETFLLPYGSIASGGGANAPSASSSSSSSSSYLLCTPTLTVNINVFVGNAQHNVTLGSFCVDFPLLPFLLHGHHVVADWFPLHRHQSTTGNVKGYVFLELQHVRHDHVRPPPRAGLHFRVLEATQLNMAPHLGQSALHVEVGAHSHRPVLVVADVRECVGVCRWCAWVCGA